ncbi:Predicted N-acetyltransferase YhbS [Pseudomonas sp. NFACC02]|uniref:GNAT family N-acetyltransferase n=1 Tax=Pseudomonas sp. NFACC02 TaxID=1566250 RepID=UPI0008C9011F|nr:GNAT family N-acetyltransferase [Pseudomonas sp. NFACC02]SER31488.1 Predicted N-acetyltransferase YhbS [Pseudomonas sp. NFACC02]
MIELRMGNIPEIPFLWSLRTRAVRQLCASHYSPEQIEVWSESPPPESYLRLFATHCALVAEENGQPLGYGILDRQTGELIALFVEPAQAGRGVGKRLMEGLEAMAAEEHFPRLYLYSSLNAADFYRAMGFVAVRDEAYEHPGGITLRSLYMERTMPGDSVH